MKVELLNPLEESQWKSSVAPAPDVNIFHTREWARVLAETYHYSPFYGALISSKQRMGLMPVMEVCSYLTGRRGVGLPFSDECPPHLEEGHPLAELIDPLLKIGRDRGWDYLEIRGNEAKVLPGAVVSDTFMVHDLSLSGSEEEQFEKLKDGYRTNIRKARKKGIEICHLQSLEAVKAYYRLHCRTRQRHGLPPQSWLFFKKIHEHVIAQGQGFVTLASLDHQWIAGAVFFIAGEQALYKFGASDMAYQQLRPNNLLMWEAIRQARQLGCTHFCFGRTDPHNAGLIKFKSNWGAQARSLSYYRIGICKRIELRDHQSNSHEFSSRMMRKMPVWLLRLIGAMMYRHMG